MPKGYQSKFGYATVSSQEGCLTYREIAEQMTEAGDKINHSTARNIFLRAMNKIAASVVAVHNEGVADEMAEDPRFQEAIQELASDIF